MRYNLEKELKIPVDRTFHVQLIFYQSWLKAAYEQSPYNIQNTKYQINIQNDGFVDAN